MRIWSFFFFMANLALAGTTPHIIDRAELAGLLEYYQSIHALHARFHEKKLLKDVNVTLASEGELTVVRPDRVIWKVTSPSPLVVKLDKARMQITSGSGKDTKTETFTMDKNGAAGESLKGLVAWLRLDPERLSADYTIAAKGNDEFRFEPKDLTHSPFLALNMKLKPKGYVERLEIEEVSGDRLQIEFDKPQIERGHESK